MEENAGVYWVKLGYKQEPTEKDLPFITWGVFTGFEVWEDTDWFFELSVKEQNERMFWGKLIHPIKLNKKTNEKDKK